MNKGLVASKTDARLYVNDLIDMFVEDFGDELRRMPRERLRREWRDYLSASFESLLDAEGVESMVIIGPKGCDEIFDGDSFADWAIREGFDERMVLEWF